MSFLNIEGPVVTVFPLRQDKRAQAPVRLALVGCRISAVAIYLFHCGMSTQGPHAYFVIGIYIFVDYL